MAISLSGERSPAAASSSPLAALARWIAEANAARTRRTALTALLALDSGRLDDLGITRADITAALSTRAYGGTEHVLNAARARNARL
ncbi:hypothetical protein [Devosia beringensis]|uniref:hypothetical protein n=1 Tax=Devosia beringensis TaxID=2657486 RepID=UPI00186B6605|nr:hypothetical protein [Devosia beringensis]